MLLSGRPNCMNIQTCKGSQGILMNIVQQIHQYIYTLTQNTYSPNGIFFLEFFIEIPQNVWEKFRKIKTSRYPYKGSSAVFCKYFKIFEVFVKLFEFSRHTKA